MKLLDKTDEKKYNIFFLFTIIICAGGATLFARRLGVINTVENAIVVALSVIFIRINHITFNRRFLSVVGVFLFYAFCTTLNNGLINLMWITEWLVWLYLGYIILCHFKENFFVAYETVLYYLCIAGLICWLVELVAPTTMREIATFLEFSHTYLDGGNVERNMLIYTIGGREQSEFSIVLRNPGFAWEPGAFSCFVCFAIWCNAIRTNLRLKNNKSLWVFLLALLSSQSSTGIVVFILFIVGWLIVNQKYRYVSIIIPVSILLIMQPFVYDKILQEYMGLTYFDLDNLATDRSVTLGRMASMQLAYEEFLRHPILGLGGWTDGTFLKQNGYENISIISGVGILISKYGVIITALVAIHLYHSSSVIKKQFNSNNSYLLIIIMIGTLISYDIWEQPIFQAFWMYGIYNKSRIRQ